MNPLIQLQQSLIECAMAGSGLLVENIRLQKAIESLTPFAMRNPVFKKVQNDAKNLLTLPREQQGEGLLKLLALVNAIIVTMIQSGGDGGSQIARMNRTATYIEIPHSHLGSLRYALTQKGAGRAEIIEEMFKEHRDYFSDYRVQELLVQGLKDSYIAILLCDIIVKLGKEILPVLQDGFDYNGKRDMGLRAWCMMTITRDKAIKEDVEVQGCKAVKDGFYEAQTFKFVWQTRSLGWR